MAEEYLAAGMTEEQIAEIAAFDLEVLRSDRRYYRHTQSIGPGGRPEEAPEPVYDGSELPLRDRMGWLKEIESPALSAALGELTPEMLELITLYVYEGLTLADIGQKWRCSHQNIAGKLRRLRRFLRRRMARYEQENAARIE